MATARGAHYEGVVELAMATRTEGDAATTAAWSRWVVGRPTLLRLCLRFTHGNVNEAEDLLSEACLKALEATRQGLDIQSPIAFVATVIANLASDHRRAARSAGILSTPLDTEVSLASHAPTPEKHASARQSLANALRVLERIPPRQRCALVLRSLGDDYSCIARAVGTSEQNARKLVQVARAAVQARG